MDNGQVLVLATELSIISIVDQVSKKLGELKTLQEKEELAFDIMEIFNKSHAVWMRNYYKNNYLTKEKREEFFHSIEENGICIIVDNDDTLDDRIHQLNECFTKFPWLQDTVDQYSVVGSQIKDSVTNVDNKDQNRIISIFTYI